MSTELPWVNRPFAELIRLSWPIAVSMLSHSAMTMVDTAFVAGIGASALAGVGLAGVAFFTLLCFSIGLLRALKILVSQAVGAKRPEQAAAYTSAGLAIAVLMGLTCTVITELSAPFISTLAASAAASDHAIIYLQIRALSAPTFLLFMALREACYGHGDARTAMVASVLANLGNAFLDYVFVVWCGWGVAGVAWATVIASAIEMTLLVLAYRRDLWVLPRVRWSAVAAIWRVGLPTGGQFLLEIGAFTLLTVLISAMSEIEMAAHQLVLHLLHISFLPCHAIAESGSVLAGQAVGADRDDLVPGVARRVMILATSYMALCTAIALFGASGIIGLFTDDRELAAVAVTIMHIGTIFLLADGANMVARGILRGTGDVRYPAVVGIACAWLCTPPLTWLLGYQAGLGAAGGWIGLSLEIFASAGILWWRLTRGHWRRAAQRSRAQVLERIADPQPAQDDQRDRSETDPGAAALACSSGSSA